MGIRGLNTIIKRFSPDAITTHPIEYYRDSSIAIDTSILLYKFRYASKQTENSHLNGFMTRVLYYLNLGIKPIFVFDGIPPPEKKNTIYKRFEHKKRIEEKIENLLKPHETDLLYKAATTSVAACSLHSVPQSEEPMIMSCKPQIEKLSKQIIYVTKSHREDTKTHLFKIF
mgnify:CR=1 FL=1